MRLTDQIILQILYIDIRSSFCRAALLLSRRLPHFLPRQVRPQPVHPGSIVTDEVDHVFYGQVAG